MCSLSFSNHLKIIILGSYFQRAAHVFQQDNIIDEFLKNESRLTLPAVPASKSFEEKSKGAVSSAVHTHIIFFDLLNVYQTQLATKEIADRRQRLYNRLHSHCVQWDAKYKMSFRDNFTHWRRTFLPGKVSQMISFEKFEAILSKVFNNIEGKCIVLIQQNIL